MKAAAAQGIPEPWLDAARRSPVYKLTAQWRLALPLHPEYRTLPMVWYVPPLSPIIGPSDEADFARLVEDMRIPIKYLANLLAAGDEGPVRRSLVKLTALRAWSRSRRVDKAENKEALEQAAMTPAEAEEMYRLLALARYDERFVMPTAAPGKFADPHEARGRRGLWE
jgi:nitrate reductase beta subunit